MSALEPAVAEGGETAALSLAAAAGSSALTEGAYRDALERREGGTSKPHPAPSVSALTEEDGVYLSGTADPSPSHVRASSSVSALTEGDNGRPRAGGRPASQVSHAPSVSALTEEGEWPSPSGPSGMVKTVSRVTYGTAEDWDISSSPSVSALDVGQARRQGTTGGTRSPAGGPDDPISFAEKRQPRAACGPAERPSHPSVRPGRRVFGGGRSNCSAGGRHVARPNRPMPGKQNPLAASSLHRRGRRSALTAANQPAERLPSS